ncbi:MAG: hypothetical protein PHO10_04380 [Gemmiger sp.]|nr:hypothetical protein [Gemmiger sp.]
MKTAKTLLSLTGWNWWMFRRQFFMVAALMGVVQTATLTVLALPRVSAGLGFAALCNAGKLWVSFSAAYLAVIAVSLRPTLQLCGKTRAGYTLLTLPAPRSLLLLGQVCATALALVLLVAWQVVLAAGLYFPITALQGFVGRGLIVGLPAGQGLFVRQFARNLLLRVLLPSNGQGLLAMLLCIAAPAVLAPAALLLKGWRRVAGLCLAIVGAGCCAALLATRGAPMPEVGVLVALLLALMLAAWCATLHSLRTARAL